ncbi:alpha/beta fold hydrolase [Paraburkholderia phosphatilytica]|uniref:alpha/beta fold hydrolase n=1 Tax=Paraburkholderia phosphatilytica TaxID=2282883 RepID=UPI000E4AD2EE|nr:alpha/beta hydrolase [Paraburkholderia phosphatilytica]
MSECRTSQGEFRSGALNLRYVEWGAKDAPPAILLHGLRSYAMTWEPVARFFASGFRLIALDQRGRGDSDWDPERNYFTSAYVEDLEALVAHLRLERFILVGHSLGGTNALVYTARHPEKVSALVVEDIGPGSSSSTEGAKRIVREIESTPSRFDDWDSARQFWRDKRPNISEDALNSRLRYTLKAREDGSVVWKYDADGIGHARMELARRPELGVDLWPVVDALRCPTLFIRGSQSDFLSSSTVQEMGRRNPNIAWREVSNAGHYVHDDNSAGFVVALGDFLRKLNVGQTD